MKRVNNAMNPITTLLLVTVTRSGSLTERGETRCAVRRKISLPFQGLSPRWSTQSSEDAKGMAVSPAIPSSDPAALCGTFPISWRGPLLLQPVPSCFAPACCGALPFTSISGSPGFVPGCAPFATASFCTAASGFWADSIAASFVAGACAGFTVVTGTFFTGSFAFSFDSCACPAAASPRTTNATTAILYMCCSCIVSESVSDEDLRLACPGIRYGDMMTGA